MLVELVVEEEDEKREDERWCGEVGVGRGIGGRGREERQAASGASGGR